MKNDASPLLKTPRFNRLFKYFSVVIVLLIAAYIFHLNTVVVGHFSQQDTINKTHYGQHYKTVANMLLLVEDQSFFEHSGVDFKEIGQVLKGYLLHDKPLRGASTLTQQLVKNALLTRERRFDRKLKEILMALLLEASFDKNFILNHYMNSVYLGQKGSLTINGFNYGAQFYFNKKIDKLSLEEIATLVALVKGPSYYHPVKHPQRLAKRSQLVLRLYHKYKKIVK